MEQLQPISTLHTSLSMKSCTCTQCIIALRIILCFIQVILIMIISCNFAIILISINCFIVLSVIMIIFGYFIVHFIVVQIVDSSQSCCWLLVVSGTRYVLYLFHPLLHNINKIFSLLAEMLFTSNELNNETIYHVSF